MGKNYIESAKLVDKNALYTPVEAMELAVTGMIPHNSLGRKELKKLRIYADDKHEHAAQSPIEWTREF